MADTFGTRENTTAGRTKKPFSKAAASEETALDASVR